MRKCPNCQHDNPTDAKFCNSCGNNLQNICAVCKTVNAVNSQFCTECGHPIADTLPPSEKKSTPNRRAAERRQLTILFCDLVDSTPLSERLDVEEFRQVIIDYHTVAEQVVKKHEGHIAQYLGDGLLVYFGYPMGLENAPKAAIRAGLNIIDALAIANKEWEKAGKETVKTRIGIHSGTVVVDEHLALGETVNIAARLEGLAPHNGIVISPDTLKLIKGWFEVKSLGAQQLKGITKPIEVFQVLRESDARTKLDVARQRGLSPLVGREEELKSLSAYWQQVIKGKGMIALLNGEAGIGKSRLVDALIRKINTEEKKIVFEARCSSYHLNSSFFPLIELLEKEVLKIEQGDTPESKLHKLKLTLVASELDSKSSLPLFAEFLSLSSSAIPPLPISPIAKKQRFMERLTQILIRNATNQTLLLLVEDLHWADESTLEWLEMILRRSADYPLFILCTTRPTFKPKWTKYPNYHQLDLKRLSSDDLLSICLHQTKGKSLPNAILTQIVDKTEGVPLFVEELTKMIVESDMLIENEDGYEVADASETLTIPTTLQDSLIARLDRFAHVKEIVQIGAILGREFSYEMLNAVLSGQEVDLPGSLTELIDAEIFYLLNRGDQEVYQFKHALIQDIAYNSILKSQRRELHHQVAKIFQDEFPKIVETQPELVAYHYTEAGLYMEAIPLWLRAGQQANQTHSNAEAIAHLEKGMDYLSHIENEKEQKNYTLDFLLTLGGSYIEYQGYTSQKLGELFNEAKSIAQTLEANDKQAYILFHLNIFYILKYQFTIAEELIQYCIREGANQENGYLFTLFGKHLEAFCNIFKGNPYKANQIYSKLLPYYNPSIPIPIELSPVGDMKICMESFSSFSLPSIGYIDQAAEITKRHLSIVDQHKDSKTLYHIHMWAAWQKLASREWQETIQILKGYMPIVQEFGDPMFIHAAEFSYHVAKALQGERAALDKALELFEVGIGMGIKIFYSHDGHYIAEAFYRFEEYENALTWIDRVLDEVNASEAHWNTAELYRIQGLCYQALAKPLIEVEVYLQKAFQLAQNQHTKLFELRAATNLLELLRGTERESDMRAQLSGVYDWFTEGLDSVDLRAAKRVLDE